MNPTILAVISIAATVILGLWAIYLVLKRKYPGEISFVQESCLGLFDSIVKNMPDLAVQYKGSPVGEGLVLIKGSFLNTGSKDISESMVEEKLSISLPEKFRWLTAKVVSTSPKVQAQLAILDRSVVLETHLFRCREYVRFEALAEVPTEDPQGKKNGETIEKRLIKALTINHRIADTQKIKRKDMLPPEYGLKRLKRRFAALGGLVVVGLGLIVAAYFVEIPEVHFLIPVGDGGFTEVTAKPRADGTFRVKGVHDKAYSKSVPVEQFYKIPGIVPKVLPHTVFRASTILIAILYVGGPRGRLGGRC